jgi:glycosyltransferase involved in cell wall biosynthesis
MHILLITPEYPLKEHPEGGLATYIKKIAMILSQKGNLVDIIFVGTRNNIWKEKSVNINEIKAFYFSELIRNFPIFNFFSEALENIINSFNVCKTTKKIQSIKKIDIIQVPSYKSLGLFLLLNKYAPVICRVSSYTPALREAFGYTDKKNLSDYLEIWQAKYADSVFSPSSHLALLYNKLTHKKIDVIHTPTDIKNSLAIDKIKRNILGKKYLLHFGTLSKIKGTDLFIEILPSILKNYPELNIVFIGRDDGLPGGIKFKDLIKEKLKQYLNRIYIYPALDKDELFPYIKEAYGVIMPSRMDNYPNACLESVFLETPVIGSDNSSIDEIIEDGKTGYIFKNRNTNDLYNIINKFLKLKPEDYIMLKNNLHKRKINLMEEYPEEKLMDLYRKVIRKYE